MWWSQDKESVTWFLLPVRCCPYNTQFLSSKTLASFLKIPAWQECVSLSKFEEKSHPSALLLSVRDKWLREARGFLLLRLPRWQQKMPGTLDSYSFCRFDTLLVCYTSMFSLCLTPPPLVLLDNYLRNTVLSGGGARLDSLRSLRVLPHRSSSIGLNLKHISFWSEPLCFFICPGLMYPLYMWSALPLALHLMCGWISP